MLVRDVVAGVVVNESLRACKPSACWSALLRAKSNVLTPYQKHRSTVCLIGCPSSLLQVRKVGMVQFEEILVSFSFYFVFSL